MLALLIVAVAFVAVTWIQRLTLRDLRETHAAELARRDMHVQQLTDQIQLNTQHLPYYPQIGPFTPEPEDTRTYYGDETGGFISVPEDELSAALGEIADLEI